MIIDIGIAVALVAVATFFWTETAKLQANIDLLNKYAFSSFERIIALEAVLNDLIPNDEDHDDQA
jgi:hypothetical protein